MQFKICTFFISHLVLAVFELIRLTNEMVHLTKVFYHFIFTLICLFLLFLGDGSAYFFWRRDASIEEFPFFVSLEIVVDHLSLNLKEDRNCGGSLISNEWILTAGHCLVHEKDALIQIRIVAGIDKKVDGNSRGVKMEGVKYFIHENFNQSGSMHNDIALVKLIWPIYLEDRVWTIELPGESLEEMDYQKGEILVFRKKELSTSEEFQMIIKQKEHNLLPRPKNPQEFQLQRRLEAIELDLFHDDEYCLEKQDRYNSTVMFCAGHKEGGEDVCFGDSGGPFIVTRPTGSSFLAGIISFSTFSYCGLPDAPSYYVRVSSYLDWIEKTIQAESTLDFREQGESIESIVI